MNRIDASRLVENVHARAAATAADPTTGFVLPRVSTVLEQDVRAVSRFTQYDRDFELRCDESVDRGGLGSAPSPLRYFLTGLAFCQQVWWAKSAALEQVELTELTIDVTTFMDMRGEHLVDEIPPNPQWVALDVRVSGPGDARATLRVADGANARCPLYALVARAVPIYERLALDGLVVRDTTQGRLDPS